MTNLLTTVSDAAKALLKKLKPPEPIEERKKHVHRVHNLIAGGTYGDASAAMATSSLVLNHALYTLYPGQIHRGLLSNAPPTI